ncbi:MAG: methyltransferase domain-containing protein [Magnetococcales bacterium]|nr:methyltransferase domain-containing protein [Magnetococcales bacterium]
MQPQQSEWKDQWTLLEDQEQFLFLDWIHPFTLEDFRGLEVLEAGCGGGQHTRFLAPHARSVTAVDLNTAELARQRCQGLDNVQWVEADIAAMDLGRRFDVVLSIGVVHHTDDPEATAANLRRHLKPGGLLVLWVYAQEGNGWMRWLVEPLRRVFLAPLPRRVVLVISRLVTALLYAPVHTLYRLPLRFLPYYDYFGNFRRLSFQRNLLNVFDKLNAPQTQFLSRQRAEGLTEGLTDRRISPYMGVSWRVSGRAPLEAASPV